MLSIAPVVGRRERGPLAKATGPGHRSALSLTQADRRLGACFAGCAEGARRAVARSELLQEKLSTRRANLPVGFVTKRHN